jgi:hypothetical protein
MERFNEDVARLDRAEVLVQYARFPITGTVEVLIAPPLPVPQVVEIILPVESVARHGALLTLSVVINPFTSRTVTGVVVPMPTFCPN